VLVFGIAPVQPVPPLASSAAPRPACPPGSWAVCVRTRLPCLRAARHSARTRSLQSWCTRARRCGAPACAAAQQTAALCTSSACVGPGLGITGLSHMWRLAGKQLRTLPALDSSARLRLRALRQWRHRARGLQHAAVVPQWCPRARRVEAVHWSSWRLRWRCRRAPLRTSPAAVHGVPGVELLCGGRPGGADPRALPERAVRAPCEDPLTRPLTAPRAADGTVRRPLHRCTSWRIGCAGATRRGLRRRGAAAVGGAT